MQCLVCAGEAKDHPRNFDGHVSATRAAAARVAGAAWNMLPRPLAGARRAGKAASLKLREMAAAQKHLLLIAKRSVRATVLMPNGIALFTEL